MEISQNSGKYVGQHTRVCFGLKLLKKQLNISKYVMAFSSNLKQNQYPQCCIDKSYRVNLRPVAINTSAWSISFIDRYLNHVIGGLDSLFLQLVFSRTRINSSLRRQVDNRKNKRYLSRFLRK